jgi:antirestriction protein ArdC
MADYERSTVLGTREVFERADAILAERAEVARTGGDRHTATYGGAEGSVHLEAHRHGPYTVVTAHTDRLRTSKLDVVVRYLMNQLPYQAGDPPRA